MIEASGEASEFIRLFSTSSRLMLLCFLSGREASVGEIQEGLGFKQPGLSQQLAELRQAGVVQTRRESRQIYYSIADARVARILEVLVSMFCKGEESPQRHESIKESFSSGPTLGEMAQWAIVTSDIDLK
ncbi:metalloregulator ArsR/SmtB family transcription factor [Rhizobium sp. FKY42]|uniref:ArsR/SmtB family transcription factor n=1 Tax=Rhizobium sp. FKY42 TaxID=2562310 RepID=UPI002484C931|nr:metalloregulator ArsR/SmtB family transcription factor [Rhizobium sp. FKY42]